MHTCIHTITMSSPCYSIHTQTNTKGSLLPRVCAPPDNKPASWPASTAWEQQLNDLVFSLPEDGHPRFRHEKWQDVFAGQMQSGPLQVFRQTLTGHLPRFSLPLGEDKVAWTVWLQPEALWSRLRTLSQVAVLKGEAKEEARARFDEILKGEDVQRNEKGEVLVHGHTYFAWTDRL